MSIWIIAAAWGVVSVAVALKANWPILAGYVVIAVALTWWLYATWSGRGDLEAVFGFIGLALVTGPSLLVAGFRSAYLLIRR